MESPEPTVQAKRLNLGSVFNFLKDHLFDYLTLFLIGAVIIGLDQWTKALVRAKVPLGTDWLPSGLSWLLPYARIRHWYNSGAAFGIFQNGNLIFTILAIIVILLILYYFPRTERNDWWLRVAMAMQFAGAAGNLIDRLAFAHVTDFISVGNFAVFNVADSSISVGVVVLLLGVWLKERSEKKRATMAASPEDEKRVQTDDEVRAPSKDEAKSG
jgi:signal peptidase II